MNSSVTDARQIEPLKVAVLGAGYFAQFHLEAWQRLAKAGEAELIGVVEPDSTRCEAAVRQFGATAGFAQLDDLLAKTKPDLLDIATPPPTHLPLVRQAAQAKIDCIVQKPLAPDLAEAEEVVAAAASSGIRLVVHENFRWMPWYLEMKRALSAGLLGEPHTISVRMRPGDGQGPSAYLSRQPYFQKMPRFLVHETAIHFIDSFRFLFGEVQAVTARLRRMNPAIAGEDAGYIVLEFANGTTGLIDGNRLNDHSATNTRLTMGE
ncbi:MAG: Gfo/Idh/MocA family protein, partial [Burkholderiaceae bacterium]